METLKQIDISVEWKKNRTWGLNPHASVTLEWVDEHNETDLEHLNGRASGCGYDKESAAVTEALNKSKKLLKYLANVFPDGHEYIYPQTGELSTSGTGMITIKTLFFQAGFEKVGEFNTKTFDGYIFIKNKSN